MSISQTTKMIIPYINAITTQKRLNVYLKKILIIILSGSKRFIWKTDRFQLLANIDEDILLQLRNKCITGNVYQKLLKMHFNNIFTFTKTNLASNSCTLCEY